MTSDQQQHLQESWQRGPHGFYCPSCAKITNLPGVIGRTLKVARPSLPCVRCGKEHPNV